MNPYETLPKSAFWRPAIADRSMFEISDLWEPKFPITADMPVATFGSCFAQHIGRALKQRDFCWLIAETPPYGMNAESAKEFNYNVFSCRTGNIYTTSLLKQWTSWALGKSAPPDEYWEAAGRCYDPFRPVVEPKGFESMEEMKQSRQATIKAFRQCIVRSSCFVFTLGLTESWVHASGGYEYPMCPGTAAGEYDDKQHRFVNMDMFTVHENLVTAIQMMREINKNLRFLLTVSPVPLTATNSGKHVLVATMYTKSVLRAVAGLVAGKYAFVDYFPSYELINSPVFRGAFFKSNQRNVTSFGVDFVMDHFLNSLARKCDKTAASKSAQFPASNLTKPAVEASGQKKNDADEVCEEELLNAFGGR